MGEAGIGPRDLHVVLDASSYDVGFSAGERTHLRNILACTTRNRATS